MIIYRVPRERRQHTAIADSMEVIRLAAGSGAPYYEDGITFDVKGTPHLNGSANKYLFQVHLGREDLGLLAAARERFNRGGDDPKRSLWHLSLSVLPLAQNGFEAERELEPGERLRLLSASYKGGRVVKL